MSAITPALQTTKRKFYKLLDGLSTSSNSLSRPQTATTINTIEDEPDPKRVKVSIENARAVSFTRPTLVRIVGTNGSTTIRTIAKPRRTSDRTSPRAIPNYQPYSQEAFLNRLKTFSDVKVWTYKPAGISELEWAKRGWICEGQKVDVVACKGGCEARVAVRLSRGTERAKAFGETEDEAAADKENRAEGGDDDVELEWMIDADEALVQRYRDLIINGHHEDCLWKKGGCKDDIYRIRFGDTNTWQAELKDRYRSLTAIQAALPDHLKLPDAQDPSIQGGSKFSVERVALTLSKMVDELKASSSADEPSAQNMSDAESDITANAPGLNHVAVTLALFGWQGSSPHNIHLATCSRCFQRIGLWLYSSDPSNKALPAEQSGIADDDVLRFDLIGLHRDHCPWVDAETQAGLSQFKGLAAWEILVRMVEAREAITQKAQAQIAEDFGGPWGGFDDQQRPYAEVEAEDRVRESKLARLKRVFTFKKDSRKSWRFSKDAA